MYRGFNLHLDKNGLKSLLEIQGISFTESKKEGKKVADKTGNDVQNILVDFIEEGVLNGTSLSDEWFKTIPVDIFISYSHNDEELALALAGWLKRQFHLNVFIDKKIWGSADSLLKEIDNIYCKNPKKNSYNYKKRNFSTSHVHAMLATALMQMIDNSEVVIFLNTSESIPLVANTIREKENYTLSPWIFEELIITQIIRRRDWFEHRELVMNDSFNRDDNLSKSFNVRYKVPLDHLVPIDLDILKKWLRGYKKDRDIKLHPLNALYKIVSK